MNIKDVLKQWAETDEHKAKVEEATQIIAQALATHQKPYVAFSGGKDSTCMLHLVLQQKPDITVWHWDYGAFFIPRPIEEEIVANARKLGAKNLILEGTKQTRPYWGLGEYFAKVEEVLHKNGYDLAFVGLRKEESCNRRHRINAGKSLTKIKECWPIQNWSWKDVWAYIFHHNLPYVSIYDVYAPVVGWDKARMATFFDPEFEKFGNPNLDGVLMWRWRNTGGSNK